MPISSAALRRAVRHLRRADPVLCEVIDQIGPCRLSVRDEGTHFEALVRSIVYQQLSGLAAATIHGRVVELLGEVTAENVVKATESDLRAAGLSRQKISYLRDLAERVLRGELDVENLHLLDDAALIDSLTRVKGIGRWTSHMFLIFRLGRPDVLPELDLGVQKAVQRAYRMRRLPPPKRLTKVGEAWAPYRSVAAWYLWRTLDLPDGRRVRRAAAPRRKKKGN